MIAALAALFCVILVALFGVLRYILNRLDELSGQMQVLEAAWSVTVAKVPPTEMPTTRTPP